MGRHKKYKTEEERIAAKRESRRRWRKANPEYHAEYYQNNKEKIAEQKAEYQVEYRSTPKGRAGSLLSIYKQSDKRYNRGECTLTADWIVENIFSQPCHYCGETDWKELGCDRIDNNLPHTPDNVVSCCTECNRKRGTTPYDEYMRLIGKIA